MSEKNDGGPAFPDVALENPGMSLRDYFAAQLVAAACSRASVPDFLHEDGIAAMAKEAYKRADAMIEQRVK